MTASNVGGRKYRNIRNHLFIVYGIINHVLQGKGEPLDVGIYDIAKCFDSIWLEEAMNNLFDVLDGDKRDDKIALIYEMNRENHVAFKTPSFGLTKRVKVKDIVMQGSVFGPIKCTVHMDTIASKCEKSGQNLYNYKNLVKILPLEMVDDILTISVCGQGPKRPVTF